jgi:L-fuculose-phosphate aldolase
MLENHGVVVGGKNLFDAFKSFETLEFMARIEINARRIGTPVSLTDEQLEQAKSRKPLEMTDYKPERFSSEEREAVKAPSPNGCPTAPSSLRLSVWTASTWSRAIWWL